MGNESFPLCFREKGERKEEGRDGGRTRRREVETYKNSKIMAEFLWCELSPLSLWVLFSNPNEKERISRRSREWYVEVQEWTQEFFYKGWGQRVGTTVVENQTCGGHSWQVAGSHELPHPHYSQSPCSSVPWLYQLPAHAVLGAVPPPSPLPLDPPRVELKPSFLLERLAAQTREQNPLVKATLPTDPRMQSSQADMPLEANRIRLTVLRCVY